MVALSASLCENREVTGNDSHGGWSNNWARSPWFRDLPSLLGHSSLVTVTYWWLHGR